MYLIKVIWVRELPSLQTSNMPASQPWSFQFSDSPRYPFSPTHYQPMALSQAKTPPLELAFSPTRSPPAPVPSYYLLHQFLSPKITFVTLLLNQIRGSTLQISWAGMLWAQTHPPRIFSSKSSGMKGFYFLRYSIGVSSAVTKGIWGKVDWCIHVF